MNNPNVNFPVRRQRQRGWSILEAAVVTALLGVMTVVIWRSVETFDKKQVAAEEHRAVQRAADAVYGSALASLHFPSPEQAVPSPGRPGYIEGWLPARALGLNASRRIRYLVDQTLVAVPTEVYKPDPLALAGGGIKMRAADKLNVLDFCYALVQRERSGMALPGGMRMGFALQEAVNTDNPGATYGQLWLGDQASKAIPAGVELRTQTAGYAEAAARTGCLDLLAKVSVSAKEAIVTADMLKLADQEVAFRRLGLTGAQESLVNLQWRMANWSTGISMLAWGTVLTLIQVQTTPVAYATAGLAFSGYSLVITGLGIFLHQTDESLKKAKAALPVAELTLNDAIAYRKSLSDLLDRRIAQTNALQKAEK